MDYFQILILQVASNWTVISCASINYFYRHFSSVLVKMYTIYLGFVQYITDKADCLREVMTVSQKAKRYYHYITLLYETLQPAPAQYRHDK